jgi:hypothetical protein
MLRRTFLGFLPAFLALAFLCGTPSTGIGGPGADATSWSTGAPAAPAVRGSLTQDVPDGAVNQSADEDDNPNDCILRAVTAIVWPDSALQERILYANDRAGRSHQPCAAPPRAPPTA